MIYLFRVVSTKYTKDLFYFSALCAFFLYTIGIQAADYDLWGYLSFGKLFWEFSGFPYVDVFSYLPVKTVWIYHEWLTGVIYYPIYSNFGDAGIQLLRYSLLIATLLTLFVTARMRGADTLYAFVTIILLGGYLKVGYGPVRAQIFTYLFFAIYLYLLERYSQGKLRVGIFWLIPMQIIWTNLHGGYLAGIGLLFIYVVSSYITHTMGRHRLVIVFALCVFSTLINPYSYAYWVYTLEAVTMSRIYIPEWWSAFKALHEGYNVFSIVWMLSSAIFVGFLLAKQGKSKVYELGVLGVTFALGLLANRHVVFFLLATCALTPVIFQSVMLNKTNFIGSTLSKRRIETAVTLLFTIFLIFVFILSDPLLLRVPECDTEKEKGVCYPVSAVEFIKNRKLTGSILTLYEWGEYLMWETYPACKVGLDGRYETVYPDWLCNKYFDFIYAKKGWRDFLKQFPSDMILLSPSMKISSLIRKEKGWDIALENSSIVLFLKNKISSLPTEGPAVHHP